jgi:predicted unusual protein kinase regulating ubiquinone biosynthesis (AarF/ABC1/UbiB family)
MMEEEHVTTLMDSLPPMDWRELATKTDLAALEERMNARFTEVDARFTEMRGEVKLGLARQTYAILVGGAALAAGALAPVYYALFNGGGG